MAERLVVAATIAKNRAWVLPRWYSALSSQTRPPEYAYVLLNDTTDDSLGTLYAASKASLMKPEMWWGTHDTGDRGCERLATDKFPRYSTSNLAWLRNELIRRAFVGWPNLTHLWSVDSDVLCDPDVLEKLLAADLPVVAAVVKNSTARGIYNFMTHGTPQEPRRQADYEEWLVAGDEDSPDHEFTVTLCGACVLLRRDVLDAGVRYGVHPQGEDALFCAAASEAGFPLYVHPQARTRHVQKDGSEWR